MWNEQGVRRLWGLSNVILSNGFSCVIVSLILMKQQIRIAQMFCETTCKLEGGKKSCLIKRRRKRKERLRETDWIWRRISSFIAPFSFFFFFL